MQTKGNAKTHLTLNHMKLPIFTQFLHKKNNNYFNRVQTNACNKEVA